jgi:hypothetical protein
VAVIVLGINRNALIEQEFQHIGVIVVSGIMQNAGASFASCLKISPMPQQNCDCFHAAHPSGEEQWRKSPAISVLNIHPRTDEGLQHIYSSLCNGNMESI